MDKMTLLKRIVTNIGRMIDYSQDMKIRTFEDITETRQFTRENKYFQVKKIRMLADINADRDGYAIVVTDNQGRFLRDSGVLV